MERQCERTLTLTHTKASLDAVPRWTIFLLNRSSDLHNGENLSSKLVERHPP